MFEEKADKVAINQKKLEHLHKPDPSTFKRISNIAEASEDNNRSAEAIARRNEVIGKVYIFFPKLLIYTFCFS